MSIKNKIIENTNIYTVLLILDISIFFILCKNYLIFNSLLSIKNIIYSFFILIFWLTINYILGSYLNQSKKLFNNFFKLIFNYSFSLILYLPFIIFFTFNYPFEYVASVIYIFGILNFISCCIHFFIFTLNSFINQKPLTWLFIGDQKIMEKLKKECEKLKYRTKILKYENENKLNYDGIIIDDNFKNLKLLEYSNTILLSNWLGKYLQKYPVDLITDLFFLDDALLISNSSIQMRVKDVFER